MEVTGINICLQKQMDSDIEVMETIENLRELEKPSFFENEVKNLENKYGKDVFGIYLSDEGEEEYMTINFSQTDESMLHIHVYVERDGFGKAKNFIEQTIQDAGDLELNVLNIGFRLSEDISELGFSEEYKGNQIISCEVKRENEVFKFERRQKGAYTEMIVEDQVIESFENYLQENVEKAKDYLGDIGAE